MIIQSIVNTNAILLWTVLVSKVQLLALVH